MKVYETIVIDIASGATLFEESYDYKGPVAQAGGGGSAPRPRDPVAGRIVANLFDGGAGPLGDRLRGILSPTQDDPFFQRQAQLGINQARGGFGARGLAGSGIAQQAEMDFLRDLTLGREEQKSGQAIQILGTAAGGAMNPAQSQPRGFMGLK